MAIEPNKIEDESPNKTIQEEEKEQDNSMVGPSPHTSVLLGQTQISN